MITLSLIVLVVLRVTAGGGRILRVSTDKETFSWLLLKGKQFILLFKVLWEWVRDTIINICAKLYFDRLLFTHVHAGVCYQFDVQQELGAPCQSHVFAGCEYTLLSISVVCIYLLRNWIIGFSGNGIITLFQILTLFKSNRSHMNLYHRSGPIVVAVV